MCARNIQIDCYATLRRLLAQSGRFGTCHVSLDSGATFSPFWYTLMHHCGPENCVVRSKWHEKWTSSDETKGRERERDWEKWETTCVGFPDTDLGERWEIICGFTVPFLTVRFPFARQGSKKGPRGRRGFFGEKRDMEAFKEISRLITAMFLMAEICFFWNIWSSGRGHVVLTAFILGPQTSYTTWFLFFLSFCYF